MALSLNDLLLGKAGDRAQDGSPAAPQLGLSLPAWTLFANLLPSTDYTGAVTLSGASLTAWNAASTATQAEVLSHDVAAVSGGTLTLPTSQQPNDYANAQAALSPNAFTLYEMLVTARGVVSAAQSLWNAAGRAYQGELFAKGFATIGSGTTLSLGFGVVPVGSIFPSTYLTLAVTNATADGALLLTVPGTVASYQIHDVRWQVSTAWTGGSSSAIGISSDVGGWSKGDLLGGASGDVAATLVVNGPHGTAGPKLAGSPPLATIPAGNSFRFDRITSAFAAGAALVVVAYTPIPL